MLIDFNARLSYSPPSCKSGTMTLALKEEDPKHQ
jgi:hypothetical protein